MARLFSPDIYIPDGCLNYRYSNQSCTEKLDEESLLDESAKYHYFTAAMSTFVKLSMTTLSFAIDSRIFLNEHQNSMF